VISSKLNGSTVAEPRPNLKGINVDSYLRVFPPSGGGGSVRWKEASAFLCNRQMLVFLHVNGFLQNGTYLKSGDCNG